MRLVRLVAGTLGFLAGVAGTTARSAHTEEGVLDDVEEIVARHIEARGGEEALRAIDSLMYLKGQYSEPGFAGFGDATMMLKRPWYKLVGHPEKNPDYMEGYDGSAWEWFRDPGLVVRTVGKASAAIRHYADVEGPWLDYQEKGHRVELGKPASIDGRPADRLLLTMRDGYSTEVFFDRETSLIVATRQTASIHAFGDAVTSESRMSDYREVFGVLIPHRITERVIATGAELSSMQWGKIVANEDIPIEWFSPPEFERTPLQDFLHHLFLQRADPLAVLWTYHGFRRENPLVDTRSGIELVGFQMLKMDEVDSAIALLEANADDYPESADSAFELARAYDTAELPEDANEEYRRALEIDPEHEQAKKGLVARSSDGGESAAVSFSTEDGGRIQATNYGSEPDAVLLVHGGRFTKESWKPQIPAFRAEGFRVLAVDLRGRGSSVGGEDGPEGVFHDVVAAVKHLRSSGAQRVFVVGASYGGWASAKASQAMPGEIDRLVLLACPVDAPESLEGRKLFILAREDFRGEGTLRLPEIEEDFDLSPEPKELVVLDGKAHAQFLFETEQSELLLDEILRFLSEP